MAQPVAGKVPTAAIQRVLQQIQELPEVVLGGTLGGVNQEILNEIRLWSARYAVDSYMEALMYLKERTAEFRAVQQALSLAQIQQYVREENIKRLRGDGRGFFFTTNSDQLANQIEIHMGKEVTYNRIYTAAIRVFIPQVKSELKRIMTEAAANAGEGFPRQYLPPIIRAIDNKLKIEPHGNKPVFLYVDFPNLEDVLGDVNDLEAAYHHGALLENVGYQWSSKGRLAGRANILTGRVNDKSLLVKTAWRRYQYWYAMYTGEKFLTFKLPRGSRDKSGLFVKREQQIPIVGSWEETMQARLGVWARMGKTPQWLLLDLGVKWTPKIAPQAIQAKWYTRLAKLWDEAVTKALDAQLAEFNRSATPPVTSYSEFLTNRIGRYYNTPSGYERASTYKPVESFMLQQQTTRGSVGSGYSIYGDIVSDLGLDSEPYWHYSANAGVSLPHYWFGESPLEAFEREQQARLDYALSQFENDLNFEDYGLE